MATIEQLKVAEAAMRREKASGTRSRVHHLDWVAELLAAGPVLIEIAEAAKAYEQLLAYPGCVDLKTLDAALARLRAALAKLEAM